MLAIILDLVFQQVTLVQGLWPCMRHSFGVFVISSRCCWFVIFVDNTFPPAQLDSLSMAYLFGVDKLYSREMHQDTYS